MSNQVIWIVFILCAKASCNYVHTFAQEWPGSICRESACKIAYINNYDGKRFNMHGLWPNLNMQTFCQTMDTCTTEKYDSSKLSAATLYDLNFGWVGLYSSTDAFRQHEWEKHGTCLAGYTQEQFFSKVMALAKQYNAYDALAAAGIHPSDTVQISQTQIVTAIQNYLKTTQANVIMSCIKEASTGKFLLGQLKFCLSDTFQPRSCSCTAASTETVIGQRFLQELPEQIEDQNLGALVSCPTLLYFPTFIAPKSQEATE